MSAKKQITSTTITNTIQSSNREEEEEERGRQVNYNVKEKGLMIIFVRKFLITEKKKHEERKIHFFFLFLSVIRRVFFPLLLAQNFMPSCDYNYL
jgi:hypothetical protein